LDIAYDGAGFSGWAVQPGQRTVQGEIETALERLFGEPVGLTVAGRTDAGVHALGQVASFTTDHPPPGALARALNALTGPDVAITAADSADDGFDARRSALSRRYRYRVETGAPPNPFERGRALAWPRRLERDALDACAIALLGEHDFTAFTPTETYHQRFERRILDAAWSDEPGSERILRFEIEADAFMRSMVRALVGTMLEVGAGRRSQEDFVSLLAGAPREAAGETAPAHGLYLLGVSY
jgi:tRNA pseudouridine38-40 synthase